MVPFILRRLLKTKNLRFVNTVGLTLIFSCIFISYAYLKKEYSYDTCYTHANRIVRLSLAFNGERPDGRIYGDALIPLIKSDPEIEQLLKFAKLETTIVIAEGKKEIVPNVLVAQANFFSFFDLPLIEGSYETALNGPNQVAISRKMARLLFGDQLAVGKTIELKSRQFSFDKAVVSAVFQDMPINTHFHTDIIAVDENVEDILAYYYLLLKNGTDSNGLEAKLDNAAKKELGDTSGADPRISLMPLTDIHLHSNVQKEFEQNGNILYIYLIMGSNILLLIVVLFNLWLNSNVIFSYNKGYYQLLRLNGASSRKVFADELSIAMLVSLMAFSLGKILSIIIVRYFDMQLIDTSFTETLGICVVLVFISVVVSIQPVLINMGKTVFSDEVNDFKRHISFSQIKLLLTIQYAIVLFIMLISVAIDQQIDFVKSVQVGGNDKNILVLREQPEAVLDNYLVLRNELLKYPEVELVTAGMQNPGAVIRDMASIKLEGKDESHQTAIMVVGDDFLPVFQIKLLAGTAPPISLTFAEERDLFIAKLAGRATAHSLKNNYIINKAALQMLGYDTPQDAIGKLLLFDHPVLAYLPTGTICGVTDNFVYTNAFEETKPMLIIPSNMFMNCFMIRFRSTDATSNIALFNKIWNKVNPDYPPDFMWLDDVYGKLYSNETNAERTVRLFSALCLLITIIGLISFTAFMIKIRTREMAIRKVNGASNWQIALLLYRNLLIWILPAFALSVPVSYYLINKWLEYFAYKSAPQWTVYGVMGIMLIAISFLAISWQSWKASNTNPLEAINRN